MEVRNEVGDPYRFKYSLEGLLVGQEAFDGRVLRYTRLSFGTDALRVPRDMNPFTVARRLQRAARGNSPDHDFARGLATRARKPFGDVPNPSPDLDLPEPVLPDTARVHEEAA